MCQSPPAPEAHPLQSLGAGGAGRILTDSVCRPAESSKWSRIICMIPYHLGHTGPPPRVAGRVPQRERGNAENS